MLRQEKRISGLLVAALVTLIACLPAWAQQAPAAAGDQSSEQVLQTVIVTGSVIKRTDFETPSPVQVMTAADLQQSGYTSVSDVLRNLSANGAGTLSQSFGGAFAGGASGVGLRGLTVGVTLALAGTARRTEGRRFGRVRLGCDRGRGQRGAEEDFPRCKFHRRCRHHQQVRRH